MRSRPALVAGGHSFRQIDGNRSQTCAVTTGDRAFCWGYGGNGEIGDGKTSVRFTPRAVAGRIRFADVRTGTGHTCGATTANLAYCWGANNDGQLGDSTGTTHLTPVAVAGGFSFARVTAAAGGGHSCGKTPAGAAYCWGNNSHGQLGDSTTTDRLSPVAVVGSS
jgi:alpha-tubulin suppressor-like RCC1 family protein